MASNRVGIGMVGCGEIAVRTAAGVAGAANARIVGCMDVNADLAADLARPHDARYTTDLDELLRWPEVEAVVISTPHALHAPQGIAAAQAGKHVLVEKPIATTLSAARDLIAACDEADRRLAVLFVMRCSPANRRARQLVEAGAIGEVAHVALSALSWKKESYWTGGFTGRAATTWRQTRQMAGGGILIMNCIHTIDLVRFITGLEYERVYAEYGTYATDVEVEDHIAVTGRMERGALLSIVASSATPGRGDTGGDRIIGTHGQIVGGRRVFTTREGLGLPVGEWVEIDAGDADPRREFVESFARAVRGAGQAPADGLDGLRALAVVTAAYESMARGAPVAVER
jgi:UDP-N-acetyl-2-amino-2-deoxyglucuronate dehydrogenase